MRLLTYNFLQPGDPRGAAKGGGGVTIYQANLVRALQAAGHEVVCMSSGDRYDTLPGVRPARLAVRRDTIERVEVVNSPVFAPAHSTFHQIGRYTVDPGLDSIPAALRARYGRFDALHFQNVEGLSAGFFRALRREYPDSTILASAHNYNLVCPQVNLWFREHRVCTDYRDGRACTNCLMVPDRSRHELNIRRMDAILSRLGAPREGRAMDMAKWALRAPFRLVRQLRREPIGTSAPLLIQAADRARDYAAYRETNIALAREVFDRVLAVSDRTRQVLAERGIPVERIAVCRIGTAHHGHFLRARRIASVKGGLHLGYLGYMRADKGFYFFLAVLEALPEYWAEETSVTIAAPIADGHAVERLRAIAHRFRSIIIYNGYTHASLDRVLDGVNLGVVPPLWEDNLPQVAMEMVSRGIPILTSDRGGAQEIAGQPDFTFRAGDWQDFILRLRAIATGRVPLARFWETPPRLLSMEEHVAELETLYANAGRTGGATCQGRGGSPSPARADLPSSGRHQPSAG